MTRALRPGGRAPLAAAAGAVAGVALVVRWRPRRVVVEGRSMLPTLQPGDRLVVVRHRQPRPGDVVAVRDPRRPSRLLVKRAVAVAAGRFDVRGDDPAQSTDSRMFGPVGPDDLVGIVVRRYGPASRAGPVR